MNIPNKCPSCEGKLVITELCCSECKTSIKGVFDLPEFSLLSHEEEYFLRVFLAARGNIKEVERQLGISYPTVKSKLENMLSKLGLGDLSKEVRKKRLEIVDRLERGEVSAQEAIKLLKELEG
ncbi:MAG: DUF2089 domain-containing protein [Elusimicrobia bacterium]|nr:DUF2089 domain-containing protein [Elusimicrobiota bacterium]